MKSYWKHTGDIHTFVAQFDDRDGKPFYFAKSLQGSDIELARVRARFEAEYLDQWRGRWRVRMRTAEALGVNVRDVPYLGDAVAPDHVFGVDWYVEVKDGLVVYLDVMRHRDGTPRKATA